MTTRRVIGLGVSHARALQLFDEWTRMMVAASTYVYVTCYDVLVDMELRLNDRIHVSYDRAADARPVNSPYLSESASKVTYRIMMHNAALVESSNRSCRAAVSLLTICKRFSRGSSEVIGCPS